MKNFKTLKILVFTILSLGLTSAVSLAQSTPQLSDAQIASAAVTANQIDVNMAVLALERSSNPTVRKFALTMVRDHTSIIQQASALAKKLGVTPQTNVVTKSLLKGAAKTESNLKTKWGKSFDKAHINHEVAYHKAVIKAIKNVLILPLVFVVDLKRPNNPPCSALRVATVSITQSFDICNQRLNLSIF